MTKISNASEAENIQSGRRDFFRKSAAFSVSAMAAASVMAPVRVNAEELKGDPAILEEKPWGTTFGFPVTHNLYGQPSPYEHHVTRRNTKLLTSGNWYASIAMCPVQDMNGIITPNGLFFSRSHGGTAEKWRN